MDSTDWSNILNALDNVDNENNKSYDPDYKILMMGTSGVGKTVFMTTMLYDLINRSSGLMVTTDIAMKNEINHNYIQLSKNNPPPATARHSEWNFNVSYDNTHLFNFRWIDYRGGSLDSNNIRGGNNMDFEQVFNYMKESIGIFILVDAEQYYRDKKKVLTELKNIKAIIEANLLRDPTRGLHIISILTKCDAISLNRGFFFDSWDTTEMVRACNEIFNPIFSNFKKNITPILCDFVPLSSYGKSGVKNPTGNIIIKANTNKIDSFQIDIPLKLLFSTILTDISYKIPKLKKDMENLKLNNQSKLSEARLDLIGTFINPLSYITENGRNKKNETQNKKDNLLKQLELCTKELNILINQEKYTKRIINEINKEITKKITFRL